MYKIVFEYMDLYSNGKWRRQECVMNSLQQCIDVYGLGKDCAYRVLSIEPVNKEGN